MSSQIDFLYLARGNAGGIVSTGYGCICLQHTFPASHHHTRTHWHRNCICKIDMSMCRDVSLLSCWLWDEIDDLFGKSDLCWGKKAYRAAYLLCYWRIGKSSQLQMGAKNNKEVNYREKSGQARSCYHKRWQQQGFVWWREILPSACDCSSCNRNGHTGYIALLPWIACWFCPLDDRHSNQQLTSAHFKK